MRVLVSFDLPSISPADRRAYSQFRKYLLKNGFQMFQESLYIRMLLTPSQERSVYAGVRKNKPPSGNVVILTITEKQFQSAEFVVGEFQSELIDSDERLIVL